MSLFTKSFSVKSKKHLTVLSGEEGSATPAKNVSDYQKYFLDRYTKIGSIIKARLKTTLIEALLRRNQDQRDIALVGIVWDVRQSKNGHKMLTLEDNTGTIRTMVLKDKDCFAQAERLVVDEVIGIKGDYIAKSQLIFVNEIIQPDIPVTHHTNRCRGKACFISDIHVGSDKFMGDAWDRFIKWTKTSDIDYLFICGDVVDGIGIYPDQDKELTIQNINDQYATLGKKLAEIPDYIKIILSPGNHDVVRIAEPQPAIPKKFRSSFSGNVIFVENPAMIDIGVKVLMYHGKSFDDLIKFIPGCDYLHAGKIMEECLIRRHLSPIYGEKTPIISAQTDRMVIDDIPDILHTGHIHISGITTYRGVLCINSGTFQAQTKYQAQFGTVPTPGLAIIVNLQTFKYNTLSFI